MQSIYSKLAISLFLLAILKKVGRHATIHYSLCEWRIESTPYAVLLREFQFLFKCFLQQFCLWKLSVAFWMNAFLFQRNIWIWDGFENKRKRHISFAEACKGIRVSFRLWSISRVSAGRREAPRRVHPIQDNLSGGSGPPIHPHTSHKN